MSVEASAPAVEKPVARRRLDRIAEAILTQRIVLLTVLIVIVVGWLMYMSANGYRLLGFAVWHGAKWYARHRLPSARSVALTGLAGATALGVLAAVVRRATA